MKIYKAKISEYRVISCHCDHKVFPYLRDDKGEKIIYCISPHHGRSFLVGNSNSRYIMSKGNGLSYTKHNFINTRELNNDSWGLLLEQDAKRDFYLGLEIESLGIRTNHMEYILELDGELELKENQRIKPILLQYSVECPYRICDAIYMPHNLIYNEVVKWRKFNVKGFLSYHLIAADVLIKNLRILHDNNILHNAIHPHNYTWSLELLDFELACSPSYPYGSEDEMRHVKDLYHREIMHTYDVVNTIAWCLKEEIDYAVIDGIFKDYGFDLNEYKIVCK